MPNKFVFVDTEYCFACSRREKDENLPNYKKIIDRMEDSFPSSKKFFYHVGSITKKKSLIDLLFKIGAEANVILDYSYVSKPQLIGSAMALDVMKILNVVEAGSSFVFISGDDYLIPIIEELLRKQVNIYVYYFPSVFSSELSLVTENADVNKKILSNKFFTSKERKIWEPKKL